MTDSELHYHITLFLAMKEEKARFVHEGDRLVASVTIGDHTFDIDVKNEIQEIKSEIPPRKKQWDRKFDRLENYRRNLRKRRETYTPTETEHIRMYQENADRAEHRLQDLEDYLEFLQLRLKRVREKSESRPEKESKKSKQVQVERGRIAQERTRTQ